VLTVRRPCPHEWCGPCRKGRQDFCITGDFTERGIELNIQSQPVTPEDEAALAG
jgi:hypothetical protein